MEASHAIITEKIHWYHLQTPTGRHFFGNDAELKESEMQRN